MTTAPELVVTAGALLPHGARAVPGGVTFSIHSAGATAVTLVLLRRGEREPFAELPFPDRFRVGGVYSMTVLGLDPNEIEYGYRVDGPHDPARGHRFDPTVILTDPYTRAIGGGSRWGVPRDFDDPYPYRARVVEDSFDWQGDQPPRTPARDLVVYEAHLRGFTRHPSSGVRAPGTFAGFAQRIPYLRELGVNCVELMPVFEFDECDNAGRPLLNCWGYDTVGFYAPKASYARSDNPVTEFKELVRQLHAAGIEVVLDVVFNHTAEGDERGRTISLRGLDNRAYYLLTADGGYQNHSGTGNTLNANAPLGRAFVLECLRHWVVEYHVDGFRFDLAAALCRGPDGTPMADPPLIEAIAADPVLREVKLIAEPWDASGLYQVGSFPAHQRWAEWNGHYRDVVRRFLKGDEGMAGELLSAVLGSPALYGQRGPLASVNFVTAHDGFTLADLVSHNDKHNEANGEDNRDGENANHSWNCGHEGPTDDPEVTALRARQVRNALVLLLTSHGVPMLSAGDEVGRTQHGNNNAYCQDELTWFDWNLVHANVDLLRFTRELIALRRAHPALRADRHAGSDGSRVQVRAHGVRPDEPDWSAQSRFVAWQLDDNEHDDHVYLAANAHWEPVEVLLPAGHQWELAVSTTETVLTDQRRIVLGPRSTLVLTARANQ
jgi:isoamylase